MLVGRSFLLPNRGNGVRCNLRLLSLISLAHVQTESIQTGGQRIFGGLDLLSRLWMVGLRGAVVCKKSTYLDTHFEFDRLSMVG